MRKNGTVAKNQFTLQLLVTVSNNALLTKTVFYVLFILFTTLYIYNYCPELFSLSCVIGVLLILIEQCNENLWC